MLSLTLILIATAQLLLAEDKLTAATDFAAARQLYLHGKFDDALATLDRVDKESRSEETLDLRGCVHLEQGKFEEGANAFEAGHAIKYDSFGPRIHHADALLRQKKFDVAGSEYEKLIAVNAPMFPEYARFGLLLAYLAQHDDPLATRVLNTILFPTESPAYYYAQAAWAFAHGKDADGRKWIASARKIFDTGKTAWFDRGLHQFGWVKKPAPAVDPFF